MGRIFSFEQISQRRVPEIESFGHVETTLIEKAQAIGGDEFAVLIFGSSAYGAATIRSDFDYILAYPASQREIAVTLALHIQNAVASPLRIPTNPYLVSFEQLDKGPHTIGSSFLDHLAIAAKIHPTPTSQKIINAINCQKGAVPEFREYIVRRYDWLVGHLIGGWNSPSDRLVGLQKIHEAPVHVARRYLASCGRVIDRKDDVIEAMKSRNSSDFDYVLAADHNYSTFVRGDMKWLTRESYDHQLMTLERSGPRLLTWLEKFF